MCQEAARAGEERPGSEETLSRWGAESGDAALFFLRSAGGKYSSGPFHSRSNLQSGCVTIMGIFNVMRPLRFSINVTLDGCCDHRAGIADEDLHRNAMENIERADALLFGRVTYEMMESAWRQPQPPGAT